MKDLSRTYVHRGDVERRRRRVRAVFLVAGLIAAADLAAKSWQPHDANAEGLDVVSSSASDAGADVRMLHNQLRVAGAQVERLNRILNYSKRYNITSALATTIYDVAMKEGIDPALAFPLVRLESGFKEGAKSPVGAIGLTQLMFRTARGYVPNVTRDELYNRELNLSIGFRYLRDLIREHGNVQLALLVYNRGPGAVSASRELGLDPSNGYDRIILKGYKGKGVVD